MAETSGGQQQQPAVTERLTKAVDDLRAAADDASGDVRARIDSALTQLREAASSASTTAQEAGAGLADQLDAVRTWIQNASGDLLDEVQKEINKRREQLGLGGGPDSSSQS